MAVLQPGLGYGYNTFITLDAIHTTSKREGIWIMGGYLDLTRHEMPVAARAIGIVHLMARYYCIVLLL